MFNGPDVEFVDNRLWAVAACIVAFALVARYIAMGASWHAENSRKVVKITEHTWWG